VGLGGKKNDAKRVVCVAALSMMLAIKLPSYNKIIFNYFKKFNKDNIC